MGVIGAETREVAMFEVLMVIVNSWYGHMSARKTVPFEELCFVMCQLHISKGTENQFKLAKNDLEAKPGL